jgi:hypothetical protein
LKIPNDTGYPWRLHKFAEYQHLAPAIDPLTYTAYAKRKNLSKDDCVILAWYHSLTYCEITAAFLFEHRRMITYNPQRFWEVYKDKLIFGSARKYVKNMDWFVPLMENFLDDTKGEPYKWLVDIVGKTSLADRSKRIQKYLGERRFMGRFSIDLFLEAIISLHGAGLIDLLVPSGGYDWKKSSNLTSGMLNIFYMDDEADRFDKTGILPEGAELLLNDFLDEVLDCIEYLYPEQRIDKVSVVNKICSFRNLFKKARYGGFHHDRQLGNLRHYQEVYPSYPLWEEMLEIRKAIFPHHMLGELRGWDGIRKDRKKLWVEEGLTGVERI